MRSARSVLREIRKEVHLLDCESLQRQPACVTAMRHSAKQT
jgi:hypothetical protein